MLRLIFAAGALPPEAAKSREVNVWRDEDGHAIARASVGATRRWIDWPPYGCFAFGPDGVVTVWPFDGADPARVAAHFERVLQPLMLQALGRQSLHASAIRNSAGALAFCGRRGAGKSTIAYAMRHSGWSQVADDALVLQVDGSETRVCPLPFTPKFWDASFEHFAGGTGALPYKNVGFDPGQIPLRAIFLLRRTEHVSAPQVSRVPLMSAFSSLLAHGSSFAPDDPSEAKRLVEDYLAIAEHIPVFALTYPSAFSALSDVAQAVANVANDYAGEPATAAAR